MSFGKIFYIGDQRLVCELNIIAVFFLFVFLKQGIFHVWLRASICDCVEYIKRACSYKDNVKSVIHAMFKTGDLLIL